MAESLSWLPWRKQEKPGSRGAEEPRSRGAEEQKTEGQGPPPRGRRRWLRGLAKARQGFVSQLDRLFRGRSVSEEMFTELEEVLVGADVGMKTTTLLLDRVRERCRVA